jgi:hypothetical protein
MAKQQSPAPSGAQQSGDDQTKTGTGTFTTDVSETDDEGTTVRQAEVREDDLSEVDPHKDKGGT